MLHIINNIYDPLISVIEDDPIRPEIPAHERVSSNKEIIVLIEDDTPSAAVCISYQNSVPKNTNELVGGDNPHVAVFYTIWSYKKDAGKRLFFAAKEYIKEHRSTISRFITLSPQTDMARKFHTNNGAIELRVNEESVNYEYL